MVSSKDVAIQAGVSQATVSRVLNHPDRVQAKTRDKVQAAIETLKYVPNAHARSLVQDKTKLITLLSGPLYNPFFVETTSAIVNYANKKGYQVNVQFVQDDELALAYATAIQTKVAGMILSCVFLEDAIFEQLTHMSIPFITYNRKHARNEYFVEIDNKQAGYLAAQHLQRLGHKRIAFIGGSQKVSTFHDRFIGVKQALGTLLPELVIHNTADKEEVAKAYAQLMQLPTPPTAIVCGADSIALAVMDVAYKAQVKIPEELSIIGIDNVEDSRHGAIQLTTVGSISERNLGLVAIQELIKMIENEKKPCIQITESVKVFSRSTTQRC
ncbi:LacI family transcriptional regulator [Lysinibacillus alkalisoli]|uniref:LacI family transcriptional regulator n=1 Tax=Lysinibacillus alkalisoli TaxID=1911548 RepID=A0A917FYV5_9BACI|nr:LacI family DNA-binding transcriptional regulator [Lysinibacillus alkalisoli]GGG14623.1 LacI family transcriptional regulator [Lysinibacillus alkalisoli]